MFFECLRGDDSVTQARYNAFVEEDDALQNYPEIVEDDEFRKGEEYPNEPFPLVNRALGDQTDYNSGNVAEAIEKLRTLFAAKLGMAERRAAAAEAAAVGRANRFGVFHRRSMVKGV